MALFGLFRGSTGEIRTAYGYLAGQWGHVALGLVGALLGAPWGVEGMAFVSALIAAGVIAKEIVDYRGPPAPGREGARLVDALADGAFWVFGGACAWAHELGPWWALPAALAVTAAALFVATVLWVKTNRDATMTEAERRTE